MSAPSIDHGGAISVDPAVLREVAHRIDALARRYEHAASSLATAYRVVVDTPGFSAHVDIVALWDVADSTAALHAECTEAATGTALMADAFEYVELRAEAQLLEITDPRAAQALHDRMDRLAASDGRVVEMADAFVAEWERERFEGLVWQYAPGPLAAVVAIAATVGALAGLGKIPPGIPLTGTADPVVLRPVRSTVPTAPAGLAGALDRMPAATGAQVAVEKYTFADGSVRYVAYVKGTQTFSPTETGGADPWDMKSNVELYGGQTSASYEATLQALEAAGARPGDAVDVVGHSQGGMIAARLAMDSGFVVQTTITAGSPVEPTLADDQTLVQLGYTDDPYRALAGGGSPSGTGSADSFTVTAVRDPADDLFSVDEPHHLDSYIELAEEVDSSDDPRAEALDDYWRELATAETIERTEFHAERTG